MSHLLVRTLRPRAGQAAPPKVYSAPDARTPSTAENIFDLLHGAACGWPLTTLEPTGSAAHGLAFSNGAVLPKRSSFALARPKQYPPPGVLANGRGAEEGKRPDFWSTAQPWRIGGCGVGIGEGAWGISGRITAGAGACAATAPGQNALQST